MDGVADEVSSRQKRPLDDNSFSTTDGRAKFPALRAPMPDFQNPSTIQHLIHTRKASTRIKERRCWNRWHLIISTVGMTPSRKHIARHANGFQEQPSILTNLNRPKSSPNITVSCGSRAPRGRKVNTHEVCYTQSPENKTGQLHSVRLNARGDELEKSTIGMYRSLLLQLLEKIPRLQTVFISLGRTTRNGNTPQWSIESLKSLFENAVQPRAVSIDLFY